MNPPALRPVTRGDMQRAALRRLPTGLSSREPKEDDVMSTLKPLKIDIVSDVVCPWCYIGKKRI